MKMSQLTEDLDVEDIAFDDDFNISLGSDEPVKEIKTTQDLEEFLTGVLKFAQECNPQIEEVKAFRDLESLKSRYRHRWSNDGGVRLKINGSTFYLTITQ